MNKIKQFFLEIIAFLLSPSFFKNFLISLGLIVGVFLMSTWFLKCYTKHGESLQVHNYIGMNVDDAIEQAERKGFNVVIADSTFVVGKAPHSVLEQNPKPLSRVKENRTIYLTVTKATADLISLPDIAGGNDDYDQYAKRVTLLGVNTRIVARVFDAKLEPNTIIHVIYNRDTITNRMARGFKVPKGGTLDFIVSEQEGNAMTMPDLICQQLSAGRFLVNNYNLAIGQVVKDASVKDENSAYIWKQEPSSGESVRIGDQVNIYITQQKPEDCN